MKKSKTDKSILTSESLDAPKPHVLDEAKAEMRACGSDGRKKIMTPAKITAIATACLAVVIVLACIPLMLQATPSSGGSSSSGGGWFSDGSSSNAKAIKIESIAKFNADNGYDILTFANPIANTSYVYDWDDKHLFCKEKSRTDNVEIVLTVKLDTVVNVADSDEDNLAFNQETDFMMYLAEEYNPRQVKINNRNVTYTTPTQYTVYCKFEHGNYMYMVKFIGDISDWKNILKEFIK